MGRRRRRSSAKRKGGQVGRGPTSKRDVSANDVEAGTSVAAAGESGVGAGQMRSAPGGGGRAGRPVVWPITAAGVLCALGAILSWIATADVLRFHVGGGRGVLAFMVSAVCAGVLLGTWLPRRVLRRRLAVARGAGDVGGGGQDSTGDVAVDFEFAATLSGGLLLTLGVMTTLLVGMLGGLEDWRGLLVERFLLPAAALHGLVLGPVWVLLLLCTGIGVNVLLALHGWWRLLRRGVRAARGMWGVLAAAGGILWFGSSGWGRVDATVVLLLPLLPLYAAGAVAVLHKPSGVGRRSLPGREACWPVGLWLAPLVFLLSMTLGLSLLLSLGTGDGSSVGAGVTRDIARVVALVLTASGVGFGVLSWLQRRLSPEGLAPGLLLLGAIGWLVGAGWLPASWPIDAIRLGVLGVALSGLVAAFQKQLTPSRLSEQGSLGLALAIVAAGVGIGIAAGVAGGLSASPQRLSVVAALFLACGAGALVFVDTRLSAVARWGSTLALVVVLLGTWRTVELSRTGGGVQLGGAGASVDDHRLTVGAAREMWVEGARELIAALRAHERGGLRVVGGGVASEAGGDLNLAAIDLGGVFSSSVVIGARGLDGPIRRDSERVAGIVLKRSARLLLPNGRMLLVDPPDALLRSGFQFAARRDWQRHACVVEGDHLLIVLGPDNQAWWDQLGRRGVLRAAGCERQPLTPIPRLRGLGKLRSALRGEG